jgi:hypothetical protein
MERCQILQETKEVDPFSLFLFSLKSKESRLKYSQRINRFFDFIEIPPGDTAARCKTFLEEGHDDSNYILNRVILFLQAHKEKIENKELASGTVRNYVKSANSQYLGRKSCVGCLEDEDTLVIVPQL